MLVLVVAVASPGSSEFAVVNFSNTPPTVVMTLGFTNGNVVDCYGTLAAVGEYGGSSVALFDISRPESPVQIGAVTGTIESGFGWQIGSISTDGSYVLVGELNGSRVALIDISKPASPYLLSVSDCEPLLNIISNVALRGPTAVVSGDNAAVVLYLRDSTIGAVPSPMTDNAVGPSDFDGQTAAVSVFGGIDAYALTPFDDPGSGASGITTTELPPVTYKELTASIAVAEIPEGGYFIAAGGVGWFTLYAYPTGFHSGSIKTSIQSGMSSMGTTVKFMHNPAIAPFLAVANVTESGVFVSFYLIQVETGLPQGTVVSFFTPNPVATVALPASYVPTLGITAFTPLRWFWPIPFPFPRPFPFRFPG
jgi:hypothetical protein